MKVYKILITVTLLSIFFSSDLLSQEKGFYYDNKIYNDKIKSVLLYRDGFELSNPVYTLGEENPLILKFDDISGSAKDYYYTIIHCDANWNESYIQQSDYLEGFANNLITDFERSFNTTFDFINYQLFLPNEDINLKVSGNYVVVVYEDNDKDKIAFSRRFYVVDRKVSITANIHRATADAYRGENQEIDFTVHHNDLKIEDPHQEIQVVVKQNRRTDNSIRNLKPLFIRNNELIYDYNRENVFPGGNEFRYFDIRTNRINGENIASTEFHRPYYHKTLMIDEVRSNQKYSEYIEMNGRYVVESQDRVQDYDLEADYCLVHFTLPLESILVGGSVHVFGALTNWEVNKSNEMTWNFDKSAYELTLLLKQGYYNYQYAYVSDDGKKTVDLKNIEGSFWKTENDYQIFVYYTPMGARYQQLIGYNQFNSKN